MTLAAFARRLFRWVGEDIRRLDPVETVRHQEMVAAILAFDALQIGFCRFAFRQGIEFAPQSGEFARPA
ncbi:hypothetical protein D3C80_1995060 [compost metagenome]